MPARSTLFLFGLAITMGMLFGMIFFGCISLHLFRTLTRESITYGILAGIVTSAFAILSSRRSLRSLPQPYTVFVVFDHPAQFIERLTSLLKHYGYMLEQHHDNTYTFIPDFRRSRFFLEKCLFADSDTSDLQVIVQVRTESARITGPALLRGLLQTLQSRIAAS